eukprot:g39691.t1
MGEHLIDMETGSLLIERICDENLLLGPRSNKGEELPRYSSWNLWTLSSFFLMPVNPEDLGQCVPFPKNFMQLCKKILTRLFRVFVHVYIHHFDRISAMGAEAHVNTCYKHFYYFVTEFDLTDERELEPLV